ncbi:hypothetical protein F2Q69_00062256 [Brassica cretica]|uniref:Uncharacterized protein n=1 Tax=Brassica cretica TaxID=69181 RepID=A0A8S9REW5_BRACR|nr:hypothetical protein F2Q69_00062256 [Brassica cretica]
MKGGMERECMLDSQTTPIHAVFRVLYRLSVTYRYDTNTALSKHSQALCRKASSPVRRRAGTGVTGCVNKTFPGSFYRLRRGVMVRMRRGESTLKVQWRDLVGIEGCLQRRLRILASLDSVYMFGDVRVRLVYLAAPLSLC